MKGKYLLDLTGVADPTGRGEGYSFVKFTGKSTTSSFSSSNSQRSNFFYFGNDKFSQVPCKFKIKSAFVVNKFDLLYLF